MGDLLDLANRMESLSTKIKAAASDAAVSVARTIIADLAYVTPVDTSRALSSWHISLNAPDTVLGKAHYPGSQGSTQRSSAQMTIAEANKILATKKPGQPIYIVNNQPYIRRLNEGSSTQTPAGFVYRSVLIGRKVTEKYKLKLKG